MTSGPPMTATRSSCSGLVRLGAAHGTITDGSHKSNADCKWLIASAQVNITLQLDEIDLESDFDFLIVYDGNSTKSPQLGKYSQGKGGDLPAPVTAQSGTMLLRLTSDSSAQGDSFTARYYVSTLPPTLAPTTPTLFPTIQVSSSSTTELLKCCSDYANATFESEIRDLSDADITNGPFDS